LRVEALVSRKPVTISPDATLKECAEAMAKEKIGLLVIGAPRGANRATAVVSERDLVRAVAKGISFSSPVSTVSTKKVISIHRGSPLSSALTLMLGNNIRHLVVEDDEGSLFGVLSIRDVLREKSLLEDLVKSEAVESEQTD
jgi:CBS domain-containing protein